MSELREYCQHVSEELDRAYERGELMEYFDDVLDIKFIVTPPRQLYGVELAVTLGGPNVYVDTRERAVLGYWGGEQERYPLHDDVCYEIEQQFAMLYDYDY